MPASFLSLFFAPLPFVMSVAVPVAGPSAGRCARPAAARVFGERAALPAVIAVIAVIGVALAGPLAAEGFTPLRDKDRFVALIQSKSLKRRGITLIVTPDGRITGRGMGRAVSGVWHWQDGYFCRALTWGKTDLGSNCQEVSVRGRTLRFRSDRGRGDYADLVLD